VTAYFHSVLETAMPKWTELGWVEVAREHKPSVAVACVLMKWTGKGKPKFPEASP
jgi:hypothetical protein